MENTFILKNKKSIMNLLTILIIIVFSLLVSGCFQSQIVKNVAIVEDTKTIDTSQEATLLFSIKISNQFKPDWQPRVTIAQINFNDKENKNKENIFVQKLSQSLYKEVTNNFNENLISFSLPIGNYILTRIKCQKPLAFCTIPIHAVFEVKSNNIYYLGRIEAIIREIKNDDELSAEDPNHGFLALPVPVSVAMYSSGFSRGTFDVKIFDNYDEDMVFFRQKYPVLKNYNVEKAILPPWKRPSKDKKD